MKGVVELEDGRPDLSVDHLTQARDIARKDRNTEGLFWAEVRLLLAEFEQSPTKGFGSLLTDVKKHAIQVGDSVARSLSTYLCRRSRQRGVRSIIRVNTSRLQGLS